MLGKQKCSMQYNNSREDEDQPLPIAVLRKLRSSPLLKSSFLYWTVRKKNRLSPHWVPRFRKLVTVIRWPFSFTCKRAIGYHSSRVLISEGLGIQISDVKALRVSESSPAWLKCQLRFVFKAKRESRESRKELY
jgi:hypothetical protein